MKEALRLLAYSLDRFDSYKNASEAMVRESLTFPEILTKRGEAIDDIVARARIVCATGTDK